MLLTKLSHARTHTRTHRASSKTQKESKWFPWKWFLPPHYLFIGLLVIATLRPACAAATVSLLVFMRENKVGESSKERGESKRKARHGEGVRVKGRCVWNMGLDFRPSGWAEDDRYRGRKRGRSGGSTGTHREHDLHAHKVMSPAPYRMWGGGKSKIRRWKIVELGGVSLQLYCYHF